MTRRWIPAITAVLMLAAPGACPAPSAAPTESRSLLSAFVAYADLRVGAVRQTLELLAATGEVRSGRWDSMQALIGAWQAGDGGLAAWYAEPDGTYYTAGRGRMDVTLSDRTYFVDLIAGRTISGALVVSKSTGERSAVIAVPVRRDGRIVGAIGASLFLDRLADQIDSTLALAPERTFYALAPDGRTTLHRRTDRHFLDPRELGSPSLAQAADTMLSRPSGEATYVFENAEKRALYRRSAVTQWTFAIATTVAPRTGRDPAQ